MSSLKFILRLVGGFLIDLFLFINIYKKTNLLNNYNTMDEENILRIFNISRITFVIFMFLILILKNAIKENKLSKLKS